MTRIVKNQPVKAVNQTSASSHLEQSKTGFKTQTNRITSREQTYLQIKGAFKITVKNKGDVGITIFGNNEIPSYEKETFDSGDTISGFDDNTAIEYDPKFIGENINIFLTSYFKY